MGEKFKPSNIVFFTEIIDGQKIFFVHTNDWNFETKDVAEASLTFKNKVAEVEVSSLGGK